MVAGLTFPFVPYPPMTARTSLDLKGIIQAYPVAEVLLEIAQCKLTGSLRAEIEDQKAIVYFVEGEVQYAVSNEKRFRLFKLLIDKGSIDKEYVAKNRAVVNDLQLSEKIEKDGKLSRSELETIISDQCGSVIDSILTWPEGEWTFSPHTRLKSGLSFTIKLNDILMAYGRMARKEFATDRI